MKKIIVVLLCWSYAQLVVSQTKEEAGLAKTDDAQTVKACWLKCPEEASIAAARVLDKVKQTTRPNQTLIDQYAVVAGYYPRVYIDIGDFPKALEIVDAYLDRGLQPTNANDHARVLYNKGVISRQLGQLIIAQQFYEEALDIYRELNALGAIGNTLNNLALVADSSGEKGQAIRYLVEAIPLIESNSTPEKLATTLSNIGSLYIDLGQMDAALDYLSRADKLLKDGSYPRKYVENKIRMINYFIANEQFGDAGSYARALANETSELGLTDLYGYIQYLLGRVFYLEQNYLDAKASLSEAFKIANDTQQHSSLMRINSLLAKIAHEESNYILAENKARSAISMADELGHEVLGRDLRNVLVRSLQKQGRAEEGIDVLIESYNSYRASVESDQNNELAQFATLLAAEEKQRQVIELERTTTQQALALTLEQKARQQNLFLFFALTGVLLVLMFLLYHRRKVAELSAKNAKQLVERKNRMLSDVSHELRTPLTAIKLQIEMLEYEIAEDPKQTYSIVHNKIASLNRLINDVFQLAKADSGDLEMHFTTVNIKTWLQETVDAHEPMLESHKLNIVRDFNENLDADIQIDTSRMAQVVDNILSNSARYTDSGGEVFIAAFKEAHELIIIFEDSSPGVHFKQLPKLFERLYRADKSRSRESGGSGLGLSIVKAFVEAHFGTVKATQSALGGLKIMITLPLKQES